MEKDNDDYYYLFDAEGGFIAYSKAPCFKGNGVIMESGKGIPCKDGFKIPPIHSKFYPEKDGVIKAILKYEDKFVYYCRGKSNCNYLRIKNLEYGVDSYLGGADFANGLAAVMIDVDGEYRWGFINKRGKFVIKPKYKDVLSGFENGPAQVVSESGEKIYLSGKGEEIEY